MNLKYKFMIILLLILFFIALINYLAIKVISYLFIVLIFFFIFSKFLNYRETFILLCLFFILNVYLLLKHKKEGFRTVDAINCDKFVKNNPGNPLKSTSAPLPKGFNNDISKFLEYNILKYTSYDENNTRVPSWTPRDVYDNLIAQCKDYWLTNGARINNFNNPGGIILPEYSQYVSNGVTSEKARPKWFKNDGTAMRGAKQLLNQIY